MDKNTIAQNLARQFMDFLSLGADINLSETDNIGLRINATVKDAGFLIGRDGENLKALQHILGLMVAKKTEGGLTPFNFVFDINNYNKEREDYLKALAKNTAHMVLESKKSIELEPMSAFERRIIHLAVETIGGVKSESVGEGEERRVVIKPV
ncbi:MAG: KH domain-containing protein [Parcubacteria group bacterium]|nr:KH domain-containing protein [Parcubacteria group bacterium]